MDRIMSKLIATALVAASCAATLRADFTYAWLDVQRKRFGSDMTLSIGGPRESEAPGIYMLAKTLIAAMLDLVGSAPRSRGGSNGK